MNKICKDRCLNVIFYFSIFLVLLIPLVSYFSSTDYTKVVVNDSVDIVLSLIVVILLGTLYFRNNKKFYYEKRFLLYLFLGFLLRLLGELFWGFYEIILKIDTPTPSFADVMWWLSYLFIFIALIYQIRKTFMFRKGFIIFNLILIISIFVAGFLILDFFPDSIGMSSAELTGYIINFSYVIFDFYIIGFSLILFFPALQSYNSRLKTYLLLAVSFILFCAFDFLFAEGIEEGTYFTGSPIDIVYALAYFVVLYAFLNKAKYFESVSSQDVKSKIKNLKPKK